MIETIIIFDNLNPDLGLFFSLCKDDTIEIVNSIESNLERIKFSEIQTLHCNPAYLSINYNHLADQPFICAVFTHGNEESIIVGGANFINVSHDNSFFSGCFFYTNSCSTGKALGPKLIEDNCRVFIGYRETVYSFKNDYKDVSLKCDTLGLISFLTQDITAYEAYSQMIQLYTQESRRMKLNGDILAAGLMVDAREALIFLGDKDTKSGDFELGM